MSVEEGFVSNTVHGTASPWSGNPGRSVPEALLRSAERRPKHEAVVDPEHRITYERLLHRSEDVARALQSAGIKRGEHVGICAGNGIEWAVLFHGILRAGAVCVPINTRLKPDEIAYQLKQSDVALLFVVDSFLGIDFLQLLRSVLPALDRALPGREMPELRRIVVLGIAAPAGCETFHAFCAGASTNPLPALPEGSWPALIQYTSGTTSFPKGAVLSHHSVTMDAFMVGHRMGMTEEDRYFCARPFFHVAGSTLGLVLAAVHSATLVTTPRFQAESALEILNRERCTLTSGNDTMYLMMLNAESFASHRYVLRGGWAAVSPAIMERIAAQFGADRTVVAYGLSEASPNVTISDSKDELDDRIAGWMHPHPGLEVRIVDPQSGDIVGAGVEGEIRVRGWCVMQGYYKKPDATDAAFSRDGFLKTGDLGVARLDGRIRFVGRLKDIIRVGGENVAPTEIENVLHQHPKIGQVQVFALPDPRLIEVPGAYIVPREGESLTVEEVREWATIRLANFKIPTHIAIISGFEAVGMTASAKVPKRLLIQHAVKHFKLDVVALR